MRAAGEATESGDPRLKGIRSQPMVNEPKSVADILDSLEDAARQKPRVSLADVVETFGARSYGPFLLVPALIEISPIGGIPGVPTVLAALVVLFAAQIALGREHLWLPTVLTRRSVSAERLGVAVRKLRPLGRWMDRRFHGRLPLLTSTPFRRGAAIACILLALMVPPLELVPFASTAPMAAIAAFGLALLVHDGLLMILASVLASIAVGTGAWLLLSIR